jgi:hypothetical protein
MALAVLFGVLFLFPIAVVATEYRGITNIATYAPPYTVIDWAQIVGAIGSVILSGLLVVLYLLMFRTQKQQVETMQQQKEWMEIQHRPEIRVTGYRIVDTIPRAREKVEVEIQNTGNGMAKNLYIRCDVRANSEVMDSEPVENLELQLDGKRFKINTHPSWLRRPEDANQSIAQRTFSQQTTGGFIDAGEKQWYEAPVWLQLVEEDEEDNFEGGRGIGVQDAMLLLHEAGVESVLLQVSVVYRDMGGKIGFEQVFASPASLDKRYTLQQIDASSGGGGFSRGDILKSIKKNNPFPPSSLADSED